VIEEMLAGVVLNLPNFTGMIVCIAVQWRIINRLMDKIDGCDCVSDRHKDRDEVT